MLYQKLFTLFCSKDIQMLDIILAIIDPIFFVLNLLLEELAIKKQN